MGLRTLEKILSLLISSCLFGSFNSLYAQSQEISSNTISLSRYRVSKTIPETHQDLARSAVDLKNPENIVETTEFDILTNTYKVGNKIGSEYLGVPLLMTPEEYSRWTMNKSMSSFFRNKNDEEYRNNGVNKFDFTDMKFDLGPAEKIFGPGGVQIKTNGSASIKLGANRNTVNNPSLPAQNRKTFGFDFDEQINLNINAKVGDKVNMDLNYNTEATFDFDTKRIKLRYEGKEDEIIKLFEAGNISFPTNSSLISGATSLFGIRTDFQFGKLSLQTVLSQKNSSSTSVSSQGGEQITEFELEASDYDENRHFFLAHYFRDNYDRNMAMLPSIVSGVNITRIELWVTNKRSSYESPRDIVAFTDLGEYSHIGGSMWTPSSGPVPSNNANNLYQTIISSYSEARDIDQVASSLGFFLSGSVDYEKISNARKLNSSEYTLNNTLGYVSLNTALTSDEVLAIAFEYTYAGKTYQVGEFASDIADSDKTLFVKLLKSNSNAPGTGTWHLMMKNIYWLGGGSLQKNKFRLNIYYSSDNTGSKITYLPEQSLKGRTLLRMMNLDRLDNNQSTNPDGFFDYIEGYTVLSSSGRIVFPVVEPFGNHLKKVIDDPILADKYIFQELYDSTKTVAKRIAEKDKFVLMGQYSGSSNSVIQLGAANIPRGSVSVTAGGVTLTENSDYIVDYSMGTVTIINQSVIDAGTKVNVSLESNTEYSMQRKTMAGFNWTYKLNPNLGLGGTFLHLNEKPLTSKVTMGDEPLVNTMWGLNMNWRKESQAITKIIDKLPFVNATAPSSMKFSAEFAQLKSDVSDKIQSSSSYIDDFEATESGISLLSPSAWSLSAVPPDMPYSSLNNDIRTGYHRALLNWFTIDPLFTRRNSSLTPSHIKNDLDQLSNHYVREIYERELYPNKESTSSESATLSILNLAYYPKERGPYNLNTDLDSEGKLNNPSLNWGGIMRRITTTNFEAANIEYIEFWMLDPFIYEGSEAQGGDLYLNLGEVSEDVLKDGKKFFENGLPINDDASKYSNTVWGRVPNTTSLVYAFDNNSTESRAKQDVGLNGLSTVQERDHQTYDNFLEAIKNRVSAHTYKSFYDDPAADNYHYYRGTDYDEKKLSILERYKQYNGTEGNSPNSADTFDQYNSSARTTPDIEDANNDYTLDEYEKYFQYRISLRPSDLVVGKNFISDKREVRVKLRNGNTETVNWYCFRVPVEEYEKTVGAIRDFSSIRFMRVYLTNFEQETHLRFGTFNLMTSQWRRYEQAVASSSNRFPEISGTISVASVNIEENGDRKPVNYIVPPGVTRILDPNQTQLVQDNEQAISINVRDLNPGEARGIYKKASLDLRKYQKIQMFTHAEALFDNLTAANDGDFSVFIRLGSDYSNNYYEYEIPLHITPEGYYNGDSEAARLLVWPESNMLDIGFNTLTNIKNARNREMSIMGSEVTLSTIYSEYDADNPENRISIVGNPSIGSVKAIMIGVRNNSRDKKSIEIWTNELRLVGYESRGGWAAQSNLNFQLSDIGTLDLSGQTSTAGYGGLEQGVSQRSIDDFYKYSLTTSFNLGRFLPEKAKISIPVYYSYTKENSSPLYSPFDTDLKMEDVIDSYYNDEKRDSIKKISQDISTQKNFSISGAKVNISSENPMPYDPSNFSASFSGTIMENSGKTLVYDNERNWKAGLKYDYSPSFKPWTPFKKIRYQSNWLTILKDVSVSYMPQNIVFTTTITRNYRELQERDLEAASSGSDIPASFSQQFSWNRDMSIRWDLLKDLRMNLTTKTEAEIEEPYSIVNKDLYPDQYELWKDSVKMSLRKLGRPLDFQQSFSASYQIPLVKLPIFNWVSTDIGFNSQYAWDRGLTYADGSTYGNIISNNRVITTNGKFNLETLYNKSPYLKSVNSRYESKRATSSNTTIRPNTYEKELFLLPDSSFQIQHNQNTLRPKVTALNKEGKPYKIKYKKVDANTITINVKDSVALKLKIVQNPGRNNSTRGITFQDGTQFAARMLMMIRSASFTYRNSFSMSLPGFMPGVDGAFGQQPSGIGLSPGLDFAFAMTGSDYISRARRNGWLLNNDSVSYNATSSAGEDLQIKITLEPITDLKIDLNSNWNNNRSNRVQYMYEGMPSTQSGNLSMTIITFGSAFEPRRASQGYSSKSFDRFVNNLSIIQRKVESKYIGSVYPSESSMGGMRFDPSIGTVNKFSADVMIPAFLATYTGRDADKKGLNVFPGIFSMLPNWSINYAGLSKLAPFRTYFKSFNIRHAYKSIYSMGGYNTFSSYMEYIKGIGFIEDVTTGNPVPSSMFDINTVSINESFSPLIGIDMTFNNGITAKLNVNKTRVLNLSISAIQMVETTSDDITAGAGYKITNLKILGANPGTGRNRISNDLNMNLDVSYRNQNALSRNIANLSSQATSGTRAVKVALSADYTYSKMLTLNFYYDFQSNFPLVSTSSYPTSTHDCGFTLKFALVR